jgi:hypothetical protein
MATVRLTHRPMKLERRMFPELLSNARCFLLSREHFTTDLLLLIVPDDINMLVSMYILQGSQCEVWPDMSIIKARKLWKNYIRQGWIRDYSALRTFYIIQEPTL